MGTMLPISLASLAAVVMLAAAAGPAVAQRNDRPVPRPWAVPHDSNMSMIDRMARRNMDRRHIERRMRLAPPPAAPRRPNGLFRR